eukprot:9499935-Pyramimonas_sp.AAC.1
MPRLLPKEFVCARNRTYSSLTKGVFSDGHRRTRYCPRLGRGDLDALWPAPHCPRYLSAVTPRGITGGMGALQTAGG